MNFKHALCFKGDFNFTNFLINRVMKCSTKGASHCRFQKAVSNNYFQKFLLINLLSTCSNWLNNFSFTHFLLIKGYGKYSLRKSRSLFLSQRDIKQRESLPCEFYQCLEQFAQPFHFSLPSADRIDYQQGALQMEPVTAPFIERFKIDEIMEL